jgi:hypothetical protein
MGEQAGDRQVAPGLPIELVQHLPFLTGVVLTRSTPEASRPKRRSRPGRGPAPSREALPRLAPAFPLELKQYTPGLRDDSRRYLPHQVTVDDLDPAEFNADGEAGPVVFAVASAQVACWDSGTGVLTLRYNLLRTAWMPLRTVREAIDAIHEQAPQRWAGLVARWSAGFVRTVRSGDVLPQHLTAHEWASVDTLPLWVHDTVVVRAPTSGGDQDEREAVTTYFTDGAKDYPIAVEDQTYPLRLGLTACLAADHAPVIEATVRLIEAHQAIWATMIEYDRQLLRELSGLGGRERSSLAGMENDLEELVRVQRVVAAFTATLPYLAVHLARLDQQVFSAVYQAWGLREQLTALNEKLTALHGSYSGLTARIGARRSRRLADFLLLFTFLSAVSTATSLRTFVQTDLHSARAANVTWLLVFVAGAAGLAVVLRALLLRASHTRRRQRGRP